MALLMATSAGFGAALYYSSPPQAWDAAREVTVSVGWSDEAACVALLEPDPGRGRAVLVNTITCDPAHGTSIRYLTRPGQYYGVKVTAPGAGLACRVETGGRVVASEGAMHTVNCLGSW